MAYKSSREALLEKCVDIERVYPLIPKNLDLESLLAERKQALKELKKTLADQHVPRSDEEFKAKAAELNSGLEAAISEKETKFRSRNWVYRLVRNQNHGFEKIWMAHDCQKKITELSFGLEKWKAVTEEIEQKPAEREIFYSYFNGEPGSFYIHNPPEILRKWPYIHPIQKTNPLTKWWSAKEIVPIDGSEDFELNSSRYEGLLYLYGFRVADIKNLFYEEESDYYDGEGSEFDVGPPGGVWEITTSGREETLLHLEKKGMVLGYIKNSYNTEIGKEVEIIGTNGYWYPPGYFKSWRHEGEEKCVRISVINGIKIQNGEFKIIGSRIANY